MIIQYLGHSAFYIENGKSVVLDPFDFVGYNMQGLSCDYCISSHDHFDHNAFKMVDYGAKIDQATGLDVEAFKEIGLVRIKTYHDDKRGALRGENYVSRFTLGGLTFAHLGDLGEPYNNSVIEKLKGVDVLFVPIGGKYTINASTAKAYCDKINPKIIVPMHFKTEKSTFDIDGVDEFLKHYNGYTKVDAKIDFDINRYQHPQILVFDHAKF